MVAKIFVYLDAETFSISLQCGTVFDVHLVEFLLKQSNDVKVANKYAHIRIITTNSVSLIFAEPV